MECDEVGSIIVTIAIITHGSVVDTVLSKHQQKIFENTRLFSKAGEFETAVSDTISQNFIIHSLNKRFQKDLQVNTLDEMESYSKKYRDYYTKELEASEIVQHNKNYCKIYHKVPVDKVVGKSIYSENPNVFIGAMNSITSMCMPILIWKEEIILVSIHKKIDSNTLQLIYPSSSSDKKINFLNIQDFLFFSSLFNKAGIFDEIFKGLYQESSELISMNEYKKLVKEISQNKNFSEEEKYLLLNQMKKRVEEDIKTRNITIKGDNIEYIRLSKLVEIIKLIVGTKCRLNIMDYSCNSIHPMLNITPTIQADEKYSTYKWGGKKRKTKIQGKNRRANKSYKKNKYNKL